MGDRTAGSVADAGTASAPSQTTASIGTSESLVPAQAAGERARQQAQELGVLTQRVDQGLVRANTEVAQLKGCRGIPPEKLRGLIGLTKSIRGQIREQVSSLRSIPGGGGTGGGRGPGFGPREGGSCHVIEEQLANAHEALDRAILGARLARCELAKVQCEMEDTRSRRDQAQTAFNAFDKKVNQLFDIVSTVLKNVNESQPPRSYSP